MSRIWVAGMPLIILVLLLTRGEVTLSLNLHHPPPLSLITYNVTTTCIGLKQHSSLPSFSWGPRAYGINFIIFSIYLTSTVSIITLSLLPILEHTKHTGHHSSLSYFLFSQPPSRPRTTQIPLSQFFPATKTHLLTKTYHILQPSSN